MNNYSRYTYTFKVENWTQIPVQKQWWAKDANSWSAGYSIDRPPLRQEILDWLIQHKGGSYAFSETKSGGILAFSQPADASLFLLRWA